MPEIIKSVRDRDGKAIKDEIERLVKEAEWLTGGKNGLKDQLAAFIKEEDYFRANEMKAAIQIHGTYIYRLTRILQGFTAFEQDDHIFYEFEENKESVR